MLRIQLASDTALSADDLPQKLQPLHNETPGKSHSDPTSKSHPLPTDTLSFLRSLNPPVPHLHQKFLDLGFTDMVYIIGIASWPESDRTSFLKGLEDKLSRVDVEILRLGFRNLGERLCAD
jgi:hypothetical protein